MLQADNQGAIVISENPRFHSRVKHIGIWFHFLRDTVKSGELEISYIPSEDNPADVLTKPLGATLHHRQVGLLRLEGDSPDKARGVLI